MGISRKNMQNSKSLCQYKDKKKEQVMEISLPFSIILSLVEMDYSLT